MAEEPKSPYEEGYAAAEIPPSQGQPTCPYPESDPRYDEWWEGFGDCTEDMIWANEHG
jgi:hypothetical protein